VTVREVKIGCYWIPACDYCIKQGVPYSISTVLHTIVGNEDRWSTYKCG